MQAFSVDGFDYLLKPVSEERLGADDRAPARGAPRRSRRAARGRRSPRCRSRAGARAVLLDPDDVYWAEANGDASRVATYDELLPSGQSMRELEDVLPSARFFRIHRRYLVNLQRVVRLELAESGRWVVQLSDQRGHRARGRAAPDARAQAAPRPALIRQRRVEQRAGVRDRERRRLDEPGRRLVRDDGDGHVDHREGVDVGDVVAGVERALARPRAQQRAHRAPLVERQRRAQLDRHARGSRDEAGVVCDRDRARSESSVDARSGSGASRQCTVSVAPLRSTKPPCASASWSSSSAAASMRPSQLSASSTSSGPSPTSSSSPWLPAASRPDSGTSRRTSASVRPETHATSR